MVDDLSKVYEIGVDVELLSPDQELSDNLGSLKALFERSSHSAVVKGTES